jgi:ribosome-associated toxin RatA of RatAB toxin-antitoxin module
MRDIRREALVTYSAGQMFELIGGSRLPRFLPWCISALIGGPPTRSAPP